MIDNMHVDACKDEVEGQAVTERSVKFYRMEKLLVCFVLSRIRWNVVTVEVVLEIWKLNNAISIQRLFLNSTNYVSFVNINIAVILE